MKKLFFLFLFSSCVLLSTAQVAVQPTVFQYTIQIENITTGTQVREITNWLNGMFTTSVAFNNTTHCFEFASSVNIEKTLFELKAHDRQYNVLLFTKVAPVIVNSTQMESK